MLNRTVSFSSQNIKQRSCFHVEIPCKIVHFSRIFLKMQGYLWIIWIKLAGALWIIGGEIRQLINILFCGYRRLEIGDCRSKNAAETYTRLGTNRWEICRRCSKNHGQKQSSLHLHSKQSKKLARSCFS